MSIGTIHVKVVVLFLTLPLISRLQTFSTKFTKERNKKLNSVFYSLSTRSAIECCQECLSNNACIAVNYSPVLKVCDLNEDKWSEVDANMHDVYYRSDVSECKSPWVWYRDHCYLFVSTKRSWQDSEDHCVLLESHLVDIQSDEENAFVRGVFDDAGYYGHHIWIGVYVTWPGGAWNWTLGIRESYDNFNPDEPNNNLDLENCGDIATDGQWNDNICASLNLSVCKTTAP